MSVLLVLACGLQLHRETSFFSNGLKRTGYDYEVKAQGTKCIIAYKNRIVEYPVSVIYKKIDVKKC